MKKVLATAGAFLMVGSVVGTAAAAVDLSGDSRVRYRYRDNYGFSDVSKDQFDSRVRVKIKATAKGGAYAQARFRADATWDNNEASDIYKKGIDTSTVGNGNVWADYYYLHVPLGESGFAFRGGLQPVGFSPFLSDDERSFRANMYYKSGPLGLNFLLDNFDDDRSTETFGNNDFKSYAVVASYKTDAMAIKGIARMHSDERDTLSTTDSYTYTVTDTDGISRSITEDVTTSVPNNNDRSGFIGDVQAVFNLGDSNKLTAEIAYKEYAVMRGDASTFDDDGLGLFVQYDMNMGAMSLHPIVGYTDGGFTADETFGFIMLGGDEPIMYAKVGNAAGSSWFAGLPVKYKATDRVSLVGNLVYWDADNDVASALDGAYEVSGSVDYAITEGANFTVKAGYLGIDASDPNDDGAFGAYGRFQIKF